MPMSVIIEHNDVAHVGHIRFESFSNIYKFPFYDVYLDDEKIGHVALDDPIEGWNACPVKTPDEQARAKARELLESQHRSGTMSPGEYLKHNQKISEMFYRWVGRNLHTRRHAVEHLLRVAGHYSWAPY